MLKKSQTQSLTNKELKLCKKEAGKGYEVANWDSTGRIFKVLEMLKEYVVLLIHRETGETKTVVLIVNMQDRKHSHIKK